MPRMRTAAGAFAIIKEQDPSSEVTLHFIRSLIAPEAVPVTHVGRKKLVDADQVIAYIAAGNQRPSTTEPFPCFGQIRRVKP